MRFLLCLSVLCAIGTGPAFAQEIGGDTPLPVSSETLDEILLKDGNLLRGRVIEERTDVVIFESPSVGRLEIPRSNIKRLARAESSSGVYGDPDENTIMFCPTPATLPKGDAYFRDFELFVLNFGFGVTDAFDLSIGTLFPISSSALMLSIGGKLRLLDRETAPIGAALTGSFTLLEETQFGAFGGVIGVGNARQSLNLAVNYAFEAEGGHDTFFLVGGDVQTGRRTKLIAEYFNANSLLEDESDDLHGFLNLGLRIFGENHSFSLTGFRPLLDDSDGFIAFPMVMYSHHF